MFYLLYYEKIPDFAERQVPWQTAHREHVVKAANDGDLILAGSLGDPTDGAAVLLFRTDSPAPIENFASSDPYVTAGIVARWWIRTWDVVAGASLPHSKGPGPVL